MGIVKQKNGVRHMIQIHQALWGYSNGHHLLASSTSLSSQSMKILEPLTDLSGPDKSESFDGYLTGCYLSSDNYYALSKTWYAPEMPRHGCVWTHTLLIKSDVSNSWNTFQFNSLFHRPNISLQDWEQAYRKPISLQQEENDTMTAPPYGFEQAYRVLRLLTSAATPIIISDTHKDEVEESLILLLSTTGTSFFRNISFCTGSFANRTINHIQLDLQIVPSNLYKLISRTAQRETRCFESFQCAMANDKYLENTNEFKKFNGIRKFIFFCSAKYYEKAYWNTFEQIYHLMTSLKEFSIKRITELLQNVFDEDATQFITSKIFSFVFVYEKLYIVQPSDVVVSTLFDFLTKASWHENNEDINKVLDLFWLDYHSEMLFMVPKLMNCDLTASGESAVQHLSLLIDIKDYAQLLPQYADECLPLLRFNCKFALCSKIWLRSANYQIEALRELKKACNDSPITENLCYRIITQIFSTSECGLSSELYDTFKDDSIIAFFVFFNSNEGEPSKANQWSPLCAFNQDLAMQRLDSVVSLNLFISVVHVLDPYCDRTLSEAQRWENYYNRFSKDNRWKEYKAEYAQFVLPIILRSENSFSSDFLQFSFSTVHTLLANDEMEYNKWEQLSNLLPEVAWYNSWDKCKRLRKAAKQRSLSIDFSRKNKDGK